MVSIISSAANLNTDMTPNSASNIVVAGLSTDDKPTGVYVGNGSMFIEMDTGKVYFYDAANTQWRAFN